MKGADVAYRAVTGALGVATLVLGVTLIASIGRGINWHYSHPLPPKQAPGSSSPSGDASER
eukprot:jgi/Mesen1/4535/ME000231S03787